jgi:hypothetical protein
MKKIAFILCAIAISVFLNSCTPSQLEALKKENEELKVKNELFESELILLKNGSQYLISEIRSLYQAKANDKVIEKADILHSRFNGSPEDIEAQKYITEIKEKKALEEKKAFEEANKTKQDKLRNIIRVKSVKISEPNSAGGVDLYINWVNNSEKTVKYATFTCGLYNAVNDPINCSIRNHNSFVGNATGPIKKGSGSMAGYGWENAWYNFSAKYAVIQSIHIEYVDGSVENIPWDDIKLITY